MSKTRETIYEPHPVTPERKAELIAAGYQIIDAVFAPPVEAADSDVPDVGADEKATLIEALDAAGIDYDKRWGIAKLRAALEA